MASSTSFRSLVQILMLQMVSLTALPTLAQTIDDFNPNANGKVLALTAQADGKLLVGGFFNTIAGVSSPRLARLLPYGPVDSTSTPSAIDG